MRILIVEDEFLIAFDIEYSVLEAGGTVLGPFMTLPEAERAAASEWIDAAVLDVRVGARLTSVGVAEILSARDIPFLFCSGHQLPDEMQEAFGSRIVMPKPVRHKALMKALAELVRARQSDTLRP